MAKTKKKRPPTPDRGRCIFCGQVSSVPVKASYNGVEGRLPHHRRRVFVGGVEVLPLCELARLTRRQRRVA